MDTNKYDYEHNKFNLVSLLHPLLLFLLGYARINLVSIFNKLLQPLLVLLLSLLSEFSIIALNPSFVISALCTFHVFLIRVGKLPP